MRGNSKAQSFWRLAGPHYCARATQNLALTGRDGLTVLSPLSILGGDDTILHLQTSLQIASHALLPASPTLPELSQPSTEAV